MPESTKKTLAFGFLILGLLTLFLIWCAVAAFSWFSSIDTDLAAGLITAFTTIVVATGTVVAGRYFERVKEAESHLRAQKIEMYDAFLKQFFSLFHGTSEKSNESLVPFLQEWQRKIVVWSGPEVVINYIAWKNHLSKGIPDATTIFLMGDFFKAMRRDIGLSNKGLTKGIFSHLILREANLFLSMANDNPNITLEEVSDRELELGL